MDIQASGWLKITDTATASRIDAPALTPWALLDQLGRILLVEVWLETRDARWLCLPRITEAEAVEQALPESWFTQEPEEPFPLLLLFSHRISAEFSFS